MKITNSIKFGRQVRRMDQAFENVKKYALGQEKEFTPTSFIADAKIKKHYDFAKYRLFLEQSQEVITATRKKYGKYGITAVIRKIINISK